TDWTAHLIAVPVFSVIAFASSTLSVSAQTTVSLSNPSSDVVFATIRGGSYADRNLPSLLATRASSDPEYHRRALLKFDTHNRIPKGSTVTSALLTVTVKNGSEDSTRSIAAYQVTTSWNEHQVTWHKRRTAKAWMSAGGDFGSKLDHKTVSNAHGSKVTFNVTALVREAVAGQLGSSRYTRVALVDLDGSSAASYREYYTPADSNSSNRPVLKVTYSHSSSGSSSSGSSQSTPAPAPAPSSSS